MRWQVRVVPKADVSTRSKQLLDYFVSEQLQRVGYLNAKRSGRLQVDDEFELLPHQSAASAVDVRSSPKSRH